ncbi:hypothetical protein PCASD_08927 [Puccinia coronata f. sp. avenae]|uniref:Uncharacterized protein n=1 Tax=Puccinia coronata f. sp. avenae TaxID=200324 RepID=A0A2N5TCH6_9BASI|nr:hypothetical protein PCASD_14834 [Puccinia coronata f. sp. avenae]PLW39107.1 hypothetical protein PCASD_08927 [Puccinia coronata f. sp. avenae]
MSSPALPALTGQTRQFERCSNSCVQLVVGQALSDRSTCRRVGQACPISSWDRSHRTSRDRSDKSVRPVGSCFGRTVPVRPPVEHGCLSTARTAVFDRLMPAPTLAAAAASVRNTQANLDRIFGPAIEAILDSNDEVNHHEAETTVVSGHFPSSWIQPQPPTPHHSNAPPSPDIPQPPPSHHASRLFSLTGHQFTRPPCSSRTSQQPNIIPPEPNPTHHTPTSGIGFRPPLFADLFNMQHKPRADMEEA